MSLCEYECVVSVCVFDVCVFVCVFRCVCLMFDVCDCDALNGLDYVVSLAVSLTFL